MVLKLIRLFGILFSLSLRRQLAFRADLLFEVVLTVVGLGSSLAALAMLYTRTSTLGGWGPGEAVVLLGTFQIVSGLRQAFVEPNLTWFGKQVMDGQLDAVLLQPAPAIYLASLSLCAPLALAQVGLGVAVVAYGVQLSGLVVTVAGVAAWLLMVAAATAVMWATRALSAAVVFWAMGLTLDVVYDAVWQFARYPVDIYRRPLRLLLTYVLPVAFLTTVPSRALLHDPTLPLAAAALAVGAGSVLLAQLAWRAGLRRYTSATS
ncbi:ABC transporter permease [Actinopolymorpha rutila]|uniref:ABC-2 type transport system permease protein n=1 Tax=Actinopolymorpha rutila TaxID=446787 RepID=A0A852ZJ15_9ACTN|nr:ABC-2 family transporter protein [Actinopolymorpha rutila]NYH92243.1 ABC-2 type transport system permease protein [Actinopolymorpha rutila]